MFIDRIVSAFRDLIHGVHDLSADEVATKLDTLAEGRDLNWRTSVVDLLKLIGLDSSLGARKELAADLGHRGKFEGTPDENTKLHAAVFDEIAARGIKLPRPA